MAEYPFNPKTDEYIWSPQKKTIGSFQGPEAGCLSPFGPVSNMNCPTSDPYCNCPTGAKRLAPNSIKSTEVGVTFNVGSGTSNSGVRSSNTALFQAPVGICGGLKEPTNEELAQYSYTTYDCPYLMKTSRLSNNVDFAVEWLGVDFSNPHSRYNCDYCFWFNWSNTFKQDTLEEYEDLKGVTSNWKQYIQKPGETGTYYFNYDARKTYNGYAYPPAITGGQTSAAGNCNIINGQYFKYYKEYSKTAATFWNTPVKTPLYRKAQTALIGAQRIKILVHGDIQARPGKLIYIDYPNFGGRWMIYKVQRILTPQKHSMYLYLMRDGVA